jgi:mRNA-degrading endonuclease RelE of RelBE toxin-antitoxin system
MIIRQTPTFKRAYKKLKKHDKAVVDSGIHEIIANTSIGRFKKGDLADHLVHKVRDKSNQWLIAYAYHEGILELITIGTHENFYRDLKK